MPGITPRMKQKNLFLEGFNYKIGAWASKRSLGMRLVFCDHTIRDYSAVLGCQYGVSGTPERAQFDE